MIVQFKQDMFLDAIEELKKKGFKVYSISTKEAGIICLVFSIDGSSCGNIGIDGIYYTCSSNAIMSDKGTGRMILSHSDHCQDSVLISNLAKNALKEDNPEALETILDRWRGYTWHEHIVEER